jgi:hypothetical protein
VNYILQLGKGYRLPSKGKNPADFVIDVLTGLEQPKPTKRVPRKELNRFKLPEDMGAGVGGIDRELIEAAVDGDEDDIEAQASTVSGSRKGPAVDLVAEWTRHVVGDKARLSREEKRTQADAGELVSAIARRNTPGFWTQFYEMLLRALRLRFRNRSRLLLFLILHIGLAAAPGQ